MPKPEPTWAQKAQNCKAELDGCHDQLERFRGTEQMLREANERIREMEQVAPDVPGLSRQIEFWKREATTAKQREASLQGRAQQLENALRQAPTRDLVESISDALAEAKGDARRAAQQAAECTQKAAGMVQRLQQYQSATEALRAMERAADEWQRKATQLGRENSELRQQASRVPELERDLAQVIEKYHLAGDHIQRIEARLTEVMPAARALPAVKADLAQANATLEQVREQANRANRATGQNVLDHAELAALRNTSTDQTQRLLRAAAELERKDQELAAANAEVRRLRTRESDLVQATAELDKLRRHLHEVTRQRDGFHSQVQELNQKLERLRGQLG